MSVLSRARAVGAAAPFMAALAVATAASAAPVVGPSGEAFYTPPASAASAGQGDLISYRPATVKLGAGTPGFRAWNVLYKSTDVKNAPTVVSGTVLVPTAPGTNPRRMVSYAAGTQGLAPQCAPSKQMAAGTLYEQANITEALKKSYAVLLTDYQGYTTGARPPYSVGSTAGRNVLDIVKAATQIPSGGLSSSGRTALWGYSQGGWAATWAGELESTYAPSVNLVAIAAGGIPADLTATARNLNGSTGAAFLLQSVLGLTEQYPEAIPYEALVSDAGKELADRARTQCVFETLNENINGEISQLTNGGQTLEDLIAIPSVGSTIAAQQVGTKKLNVPLYQYHGQADEFIPLDQAIALKRSYCAKGVRVKFDLYPSEHLATQTQAGPLAVSYLASQFAGAASPSTCSTSAPEPVSTAPPGGGDFVVNLTNWKLSGTARLDRLSSTLTLPSTSTFTGSANLTSNVLSSPSDGVKIPPFTGRISLAGLGVNVAVRIVQAAPLRGSSSLDDNGYLHLNGFAPVTIYIRSLNVFGITLGTNCRTKFPVQIPYRFDGPVASIGTGGLRSSTTTSIPEFVDCGIYGPLLSALVSAPNNRFTLTQTPPAPKPY